MVRHKPYSVRIWPNLMDYCDQSLDVTKFDHKYFFPMVFTDCNCILSGFYWGVFSPKEPA